MRRFGRVQALRSRVQGWGLIGFMVCVGMDNELKLPYNFRFGVSGLRFRGIGYTHPGVH